ncbi:ion channel [Microbaculum marinum]|uniref:Ion channel n=1 Tax=Microbaculum marinum TaxID=1764581 RepID=A0AAW9RQU2_9HYPH
MFDALVAGASVSLLNIAIHAAAMSALVRALASRIVTAFHRSAMVRLVVIMVTSVAVLMAAHILEVWVWSQLYRLLGVAPATADQFAFAFVNYTTLGYGNVLPEPQWEVIGPMTAMNGVLLFGWSTAVLFQVLSVSYKELDRQIQRVDPDRAT